MTGAKAMTSRPMLDQPPGPYPSRVTRGGASRKPRQPSPNACLARRCGLRPDAWLSHTPLESLDRSARATGTVSASISASRFLLQTLGQLAMAQRLERLISTAIGANDNFAIQLFAPHVVRLPASGYGTTQFNLTDAERQPLVDAGREPMRAHLARLAEEADLGAPKDLGAINLVALANQVAGSMLS